MPKRRLVLLSLAAVSGCATTTSPPPPVINADGGTCRPVDQSRVSGQPATPEYAAILLQESGARMVRWVPEGSMITMEFSPERLTVRLDRRNLIVAATCG